MVALGDALGTATRPTTLDTELNRVIAGVRTLFSAAACSCARVQNDGSSLVFVAADGAGADSIVGVELSIQRGIAGWVAMSGQPIAISAVAQDVRFARDVAESTNYIPDTILAAPLVDENGEVVGVIEVLDPQSRGPHSGHDLDTLGLVASQLASIIRLCEVYDALGEALLTGLVRSGAPDDFAAALAEVSAAANGHSELVALAQAFHALSSTGARGAALAANLVNEVAAFARIKP